MSVMPRSAGVRTHPDDFSAPTVFPVFTDGKAPPGNERNPIFPGKIRHGVAVRGRGGLVPYDEGDLSYGGLRLKRTNSVVSRRKLLASGPRPLAGCNRCDTMGGPRADGSLPP